MQPEVEQPVREDRGTPEVVVLVVVLRMLLAAVVELEQQDKLGRVELLARMAVLVSAHPFPDRRPTTEEEEAVVVPPHLRVLVTEETVAAEQEDYLVLEQTGLQILAVVVVAGDTHQLTAVVVALASSLFLQLLD